MANRRIPVSYDFFKKYTFHLEIVDIILKSKASEQQYMYSSLHNSEECKERTLREYYEDFYLRPEIREKYHIRLKPIPRKIKEQILALPSVQCAGVINDAETVDIRNNIDNPYPVQLHRGITLEVENEALCYPNVSATSEHTNSRTLRMRNADGEAPVSCEALYLKKTVDERLQDSCSNKGKSCEVQEQNTEFTMYSYRDLKRYRHCCPVSYKEFCKYSNINELIRQCSEQCGLDTKNHRTLLHRSYIFFYLSPLDRNTYPLNKLQPSENCPLDIRNKFFMIARKCQKEKSTQVNTTVTNGACVVQVNKNQTTCLQATVVDQNEPTNSAAFNNNQQKIVTTSPATETLPSSYNSIPDVINWKAQEKASAANLTTCAIKRSSNENMNSASSKRQKTQLSPTAEKTKEVYKDVLPYAHCCPVMFSEFKTFTNVNELFSTYCQKRYNSLKKLPFILHRAYLLYFLAPEYRELNPFKSLKVLPQCPEHLEHKMFEIPTDLYLNGELRKNVAQPQMNLGMSEEEEAQTQFSNVLHNQPPMSKNKIEILENLLFPNTRMSAYGISNVQNQCPNTDCVFHFIDYLDFIKHINILKIHNIIKERTIDEIKDALFCAILKHKKLCAKSTLASTTPSPARENEKISEESENEEHVTQKNNGRTQTTTETVNMELGELQKVIVKRSSSNKTEGLTNNIKDNQPPLLGNCTLDIRTHLKSDKIIQLFCSKLLAKLNLNQTYDTSVDFTTDCYEIFLQCNEIPLRQMLNDFCAHDEEIVQRILNNNELCSALKRYYYIKYLTNPDFSAKYPTKIKEENLNENTKKSIQETCVQAQEDKPETIECRSYACNEEKTIHSKVAKVQVEKAPEISPSNNNILEKAKRIFFRQVEETNTLSYILCTSFGLKQLILRTVLSLTFEDFLQLTTVYEGKQLYDDKHIAESMYRYVFRTPLVWPTNLFITLKNLCDLLHSKNIRFNDYPSMLTHISPKLLHWSVLLPCTNIVECVVIDYEKRTGKLLDTNDIHILKQECIEYYDRCWKHEKWLGQIPRVDADFYKDYLTSTTEVEVTTFAESDLQEIVERQKPAACGIAVETNDIGSISNNDEEQQASVHTTNTNHKGCFEQGNEAVLDNALDSDPPFKEFNCIILPNTQQQIEMLPAEVTVTNDPLNNSVCKLNSSVDSEDDAALFVGEVTEIPIIKTERIEEKLLTNLLFYVDDNSNIQCTPYEEDIVSLDETNIQDSQNLPSSQIEFNELITELKLSDNLTNTNSGSSIMNLRQCLASSSESNDATAISEQFMQQQGNVMPSNELHLIELPNVSLRSSGDIDYNQNNAAEHVSSSGEISISVQKSIMCPEAQHFPSTFENFLAFSASGEQQSNRSQQELMTTPTVENIIITPVDNAVFSSDSGEQHVVAEQPETFTEFNPPQSVCRGILKTSAAAKSQQNVAKVKPFKKSDFVPQIVHNTRPLPTKTAHLTLQTVIETTPTSSTTLEQALMEASSQHSEQNLNTQLQLPPPTGTQIHISQELNKNCSIFNNSSLLRIADHNYNKVLSQGIVPVANMETPSNQAQQELHHLATENVTKVKQPGSRTSFSKGSTSTDNESQSPSRRVTRRSSVCQDASNKNYSLRNKQT